MRTRASWFMHMRVVHFLEVNMLSQSPVPIRFDVGLVGMEVYFSDFEVEYSNQKEEGLSIRASEAYLKK